MESLLDMQLQSECVLARLFLRSMIYFVISVATFSSILFMIFCPGHQQQI